MAKRHFPVRPNLEQLKHQAKDLLRAFRRGDAEAREDFREHLLRSFEAGAVRLADAQSVLARSYGLRNWARLVTACRMTDAIWRGDVNSVRALVVNNPKLIAENARGVEHCNWGPPMSYAANVGQDAIIEMLRGLGAEDLAPAFNRACLQGQIGTARRLHEMMGAPRPRDGALTDPAYTLNVEGTELLLTLGARVYDDEEIRLAPVHMVLETDSRNPAAKHRILELYAEHGFQYPDTAMMALHRGRVDLLEEHLRRDSGLAKRRFAFEEIFRLRWGVMTR